jgi:UDP-2,3-diacylglucosamine hydrolase
VATLFVSDAHLSAERPERVQAFLEFLAGAAARADALYLLGDVFDLWLGDDDLDWPNGEVVAALAALTRGGVPAFALHGNHDFLIGPGFVQASGCQLLRDPAVLDLYGQRVLASHGDYLCTDDSEYLAWRAYSRAPQTQQTFLAQPLAARRAQAAVIREKSHARSRLKPQEIMDVNAGAVAAALREHAVRHLIHGHTHRPGVYPVALADGTPGERVVLGDWYEADSVLVWGRDGHRLCRVRDLEAIL